MAKKKTQRELDQEKQKEDLKASFGKVVLEAGKAVLNKKASNKTNDIAATKQSISAEELFKQPENPFTKPELGTSTAPPTQPDSKEPKVFTDSETGRPTGVEINGKLFLGLKPSEIEKMLTAEKAKTEILPETAATQESAVQGEQARFQEVLSAELGKVTFTGDVEKDKISYEQAWKSALATSGAGAVGAAAVGAVGGGPVGAVVGGVAGAIGGFILGFKNNLKTQRTDMVKGEQQNLMKTEQNMLKQVMLMNQLPRLGGNTDDMVEIRTMFDEQMAITDENYKRLKMETDDDLSKWLGEDGHKQLEKYSTFNSPGGMREILVAQMELAINSPDLGRLQGLEAQYQAAGVEEIE